MGDGVGKGTQDENGDSQQQQQQKQKQSEEGVAAVILGPVVGRVDVVGQSGTVRESCRVPVVLEVDREGEVTCVVSFEQSDRAVGDEANFIPSAASNCVKLYLEVQRGGRNGRRWHVLRTYARSTLVRFFY